MRALAFVCLIVLAGPVCADDFEDAVVGPGKGADWIVPTYQRIDPHGRHVLFPGRPTGIALRSDGAVVAVLNRSDLLFLDPGSGQVRHTLPLERGGHAVTGICFSADGGRVYTSTTDGAIAIASCPGDEPPAWIGRISLPTDRGKSQPAGLTLGPDPGQLLVCLGRRNTLGLLDLASGTLVEEAEVGIAPFDVVVVGRRAYVSNWGGDRPQQGDVTGPTSGSQIKVDARGIAREGSVSVVDLDTFAPVRSIPVGRHACGMALHPNGRHLFVANANEDTVSVIDTASDRVVETITVRSRHILPFGSAPNAVAVGPRGTLLAVANGGNNAVAVVRLGRAAGGRAPGASRVAGFVPVGWYPGAVAVAPDGRRLWVANTKGVGSRARPEGRPGFNSHQHMGSVSAIALPLHDLPALTERVARNNREAFALADRARRSGDPVPVPLYEGERSVFKHVLYIIKENRTYDQVFGDMPEGNGAPELCHFGEEVTPNHHALAREFGLFDNLYCSGILSADGHHWTDAAYVTDYIEKSFGGFIRSYPYDGGDALAYASSGFLWDSALERGLSLRIYGEFVKAVIEPQASWSEIYHDYLDRTGKIRITAQANIPTLEPYLCPTFIGFPGTVTDQYRADQFLKELRAAETSGRWHDLMIMLLPNDHTVGTRPSLPTPRAAVADNDLALGRIVDAVSHSRFWPETIIFVIEDDPQAGLDHVDGHRTVGFVISPYNRRGVVDSHFYAQTSIVRTIELILGLPAMNQFDLGAAPITTCFQDQPDLRPYAARPNRVALDELNPPLEALSGPARYWAEVSLGLDLDDIDEADEDTFNRVLWHSVKGYDVPYPELSRSRPGPAQG